MSGKLDRGYVSLFLTLIGVLAPGRSVVLSDGTRTVILRTNANDPLTPVVEREDGDAQDLSLLSNLSIQEVKDETA